MQFQPYPKYKPSGIEWLGEIPEEWEVKRLKDFGIGIIGMTYSPDDTVDSDKDGLLVLRSSNIQDGKVSFHDNVYIDKKIPQKLITKIGDILICSRNGSRALIGKNICINQDTAGYTFGAFMTVFRSKSPRFLSVFFNSQLFDFQSGAFMTSTINQLTIGTLHELNIVAPKLKKDQTAIADYLDKYTALIDKKIELLKAKKQSYTELKQTLINEIVTKGLDKAVEMKDSGIEWIGQIPKHWEVKRLKDEFELLPSGIKFFEGNKEYLSTASIGENEIISIEETITFAERPSRANMQPKINTAWFAKMKDTNKSYIFSDNEECKKYILSTGFCSFDVNKNHLNFIKYYIVSKYFIFEKDMYSYGTTQFSINDTNISQINFVKPPKSEQIAIANYLDEKTNRIDQIIKKIDENILALQEFRKTLINDTVTGKVKVL